MVGKRHCNKDLSTDVLDMFLGILLIPGLMMVTPVFKKKLESIILKRGILSDKFVMTETEFFLLVEKVYEGIESQIEKCCCLYGIDIEIERNGYVLSIIFQDGLKVVINTQAVVQEIWLASRANGFHYRYIGKSWKETRGGPDFPEMLSRICSEYSGIDLKLEI